MKKGRLDLAKVLGPDHEHEWVAITRDYSEVIGYDKSLVSLKRSVGSREVVYRKIPTANAYLTF